MENKEVIEMLNLENFTVEKIDVEKLIPHPKNPRIDLRPGMPLYDKLKDSIEHHDYIDPIIWNKRTGHIIAGHQRFQVIKDLAEREGIKLDKLKVVVVDKSENEEITFLVSDNKITGMWDNEKLEALFREMPEDDLKFTGYDDFEIQQLLADDDTMPIDDDEPVSHTNKNVKFEYVVEIVCSDENEQKDVFEKMKNEGYKCRISM